MSKSNAPRRPRPAAILAVLGLALLAAGPLAGPTDAASTASRIEARVLELVNQARAELGVDPLHTTAKLVDLAGDRARHMVKTGVLKHPKCLPCKFKARNIPYSGWGETIAWTYGPWAKKAGKLLFNIWKHSPPHWAILTSPHLERIGVGLALKSNGSIWAAAVLTS